MSSHVLSKLTTRDSTLSQASRQLLLDSLGTTEFVRAGEDFVREGTRPDRCTVILAGWASRYSRLADGRRQMLALNVTGDFVDLHSFPLKTMDHSVGAITDCAIASITHAQMQRISETDPHLTRLLWLMTLIDAAILRQWLLSSGQRSSLEHTAHLICELFTRLQAVSLASPEGTFELPLSQQEFGDAVGISSVHVSRTISELKRLKLCNWRKGTVEIVDWEGLRRLAEFDPVYLSLTDEPR